jgi:hypothetical protein
MGSFSTNPPIARDPPVPMLCTPETSRAAIPAIFVTTESAIEVLPFSVKRSLPPVAEVLAKLPLIPLPPFFRIEEELRPGSNL